MSFSFRSSISCLAMASLLTVSLATAQETETRPNKPAPRLPKKSLSTTVHEAWLQEVLDLDVRGAVKVYDWISKRAPINQPERWLAVTRLAELQRLGIVAPEPGPLQPPPPAVAKALRELYAPLPTDQLIEDPDADLQLPALHPATMQVQDWVRNQIGPSVDDRLRLRLTRDRSNTNRRPSDTWYAYDILRVELRNRPTQAQALRTLYFANWQPPTWQAKPEEQLALLKQQLQAWIDDEGTSSPQRALLRRLGDAVDERAKIDPNQALDFVARMPIYAERLLLPPKPKPEPVDNGGGR